MSKAITGSTVCSASLCE